MPKVKSQAGPYDVPYLLPSGAGTKYQTHYFEYSPRSAHLVLARDVDKPVVDLRLATACSLAHQLGSVKCDCGTQMRAAQEQLAVTDNGAMMIYSIGEDHEGRGAGELNHVRAYVLQHRERIDTVTSYEGLGIEVDPRNYGQQVHIMRKFGLHERKRTVRVLTNNPGKVSPLREAGFRADQLLLNVPVTKYNYGQLLSRQRGLGHTFDRDLGAMSVEGAIVPRTNGELEGVDYSVDPHHVPPDGQRYGPFPLPYAIDGTDEGRIVELATYYYIINERMYFAVRRPDDQAHDAEVEALSACMPGHILGSTLCDCRAKLRRVMQCMAPDEAKKAAPLLIFALGYYDRRDDLEPDEILAHLRGDTDRREMSWDHPHARTILADLGVDSPRPFPPFVAKNTTADTSTNDRKKKK